MSRIRSRVQALCPEGEMWLKFLEEDELREDRRKALNAHFPKSLENAEKVLKPETVAEFYDDKMVNRYGYRILEIWAGNQPDELRILERKQGFPGIYSELRAQQKIEEEILEKEQSQEQLLNGLVPHEILAMHGVETKLMLSRCGIVGSY